MLAALAEPVRHHRTAEFRAIFREVATGLAEAFMVPGDQVLILPGSGSLGLEAAFLATVPAGAKVVVINGGKFGERWIRIARAHGAEIVELSVEWGRAAQPDDLAALLRGHPDATCVLATHSETSTGVLHDIEALARAARAANPQALFLVDAVTSLASAELRPSEWGLDAVVSGSQKGLLAPPGLAYVWLSGRAWTDRQGLRPGFYLDLRAERAAQAQGDTRTTPATSLVVAQRAALRLLLAEGMAAVWQRRARLTELLLEGAAALGFTDFAERVTPAVAALRVPEGVDARDIVAALEDRGITIAGGQDHLASTVIRPSLLGHADELDAAALVSALGAALAAVRASARA